MPKTPLLVLGSKNYSSWSLRPWLFLRKARFDFEERMIYFDAPDFRQQIAALSPSRRVPLLLDTVKIWDSLAICEYAAEQTGFGLPKSRAARAVARSMAAEMHSGFPALREQCPMNVRARNRRIPDSDGLRLDIDRIDALWSDTRRNFGGGGGWLFGDFSIADAMFAPVLFRFQTYGATLSEESKAYLAHGLADPLIEQWQAESQAEGHPLAEVDGIGLLQSSANQD